MNDAFCGDIGQYRRVITADGTSTLWSEHFQEHFHSQAGARSETVYNFIEGCEIVRFSQQPANILEVGLGCGIGVEETFRFLDVRGAQQGVHFISLELDAKLLQWCQNSLTSHFQHFPSLRDLRPCAPGIFSAQVENNRLSVLLGDARYSLPKFWAEDGHRLGLIPPRSKVNAIYQDPFAPKKNSTLWSVPWFTFLRSIAANDCILSTYSSAIRVRKALVAADWQISDRPGHGQKRSATLARTFGQTADCILRQLANSALAPYQD